MILPLIALLSALAASPSAQAGETCVTTGRETELMKGLPANALFSMAPDGKMGLVWDPAAKKATAIFFPSLRRQELDVKAGHPMPLREGRVSIADLSQVTYGSSGAPLVDEKKVWSKIVDLATGATKDYPGTYFYVNSSGVERGLAAKEVNQNSAALSRLAQAIPATQSVFQTWGSRVDFPLEGLPPTYVNGNEIRILPPGAREFTQIRMEAPQGKKFVFGGISPDGKKLLGSFCDEKCGTFVTMDIATGATRNMEIPEAQRWPSFNNRGTFTPEGNFIPANATLAIDFSSQKLVPLEGFPAGAYGRIANGRYCAETGSAPAEEQTSSVCFDTATGKKIAGSTFARYSSASMYYNASTYAADGSLVSRAGDRLILIRNDRVCSHPQSPPLAPECETLTPALLPADFMGSLGAALRCESDYLPAGFPQELDETQFSEMEAVRWLEKLSKPGAFSSAADLRALRAVVNRGWEKKYPDETKSALAGVLATSPSAYVQLLNENPALAGLKGKVTFSCLTPGEKETVTAAARAFLENTQKGSMRPVAQLAKSASRLADGILDEEARYKMADDLATAGLERVTRFGNQVNIFPYKLHVILNNTARRELGLTGENVTDISLIKKEGEILPVLMASTDQDGMQIDPMLGIATKPLPPIKIDNLPLGATEKDIAWTYDGKNYETKVTLTRPLNERKVISEAKAPDYKSMWKDGELRGLVVVGSNMEGDLTDKTTQAYLSYYMKNGFKFAKPTEVKDLKSLMKDRISGANGADYFIKEAHSDGDQQNLFEIPKSARLIKGERTVKGRKETLEILFPTSENSVAEKLSNADFGDWIKEREKAGGGQFLYLNSSCWSAQKAPFEVAAAYSPALLNIASTGMVDTFEDKPTNVMRIMVESIRKGQNYDQMRKNLEKDPEYKAKTANTFVFPDSEDYKTHITQKMTLPVTIDAKLYRVESDGTKMPYSAEQ